jgi:hypothetical protein
MQPIFRYYPRLTLLSLAPIWWDSLFSKPEVKKMARKMEKLEGRKLGF